MDILRLLPNNEYQAAVNANAPTAINPFATIADLAGGGGIYGGSGGLVAGTTVVTMNSGDFLRFSSLTGPTDLFTLDAANNRVGIGTAVPGYELHLVSGNFFVENGRVAIGGTAPANNYGLYIATDNTFGNDHRGQRIVLGGDSVTATAQISGLEIRTLNTKTAAGTNNYRFIDINATGGATVGTYNLIGMRVKLDTFTNLGSATINRYIGEFIDGNEGLGKVLADVTGTGYAQWVDPNTLVTTPTLATVLAAGSTSGANNITMSAGQEILFTSGAFFGYLGSAALTSDRTYDLPDKSGTLAMTTDTIYGGDGTIGSTRTATLTDTLNFDSGFVGMRVASPTAYLHLGVGTATASTAPLKFTTGTLNTTAESGAMEYASDFFYLTTNLVRTSIATYGRTVVNASSYNALVTDRVIGVTYTTTGSCTINLPSAALFPSGYEITIKDEGLSATANNITIDGSGTQTIDGDLTFTLATDGDSVTIYSNGTDAWFIK